jgi:N-acetyl-1-D-myo-inositol-2-amino-2-deoxy-alpha-D-glucopyranoside deacetylase
MNHEGRKSMPPEPESVLFVHAHPDDETITTGGTIAALVDAGTRVTVLTCTRGELGEVIPAELQYLLDDRAALAAWRETELAGAMAALGVTDHRWLGAADARWQGLEPRRYVDSGMRWGKNGAEALESVAGDSLSAAPLDTVAADIAAVIGDVEATAVVSYDARGGYGHPDHVRAHDASVRAAEVMGIPFFEFVTAGDGSVVVDVAPVAGRKRAALAAHRTQLTVRGDDLVLSNGVAQPIALVETFGRPAPPSGEVPYRDLAPGTKVLVSLVFLALGALVGLLMTAVHQADVVVAGVALPWGLVLGLVATVGLVVGSRVLTGTRYIPALVAVGLMGMTAFLASPTRGGSVIVAANPAGYIWTFAPAVITLVALAWPNLARDRAVTAKAQRRDR